MNEPKYLYLELPLPPPPEHKDSDEEDKASKRGILVIDLFAPEEE